MGERTILRLLRLAALVVAGSDRSLTGAPLPPNPRGSLRSQQLRDQTKPCGSSPRAPYVARPFRACALPPVALL